MSYRLRVYAPVDSRYSQILILNGNVYLDRVSPAGDSTPCYDGYIDGFDVNVNPTFDTEQQYNDFAGAFSRWVVNVDGRVSYQTPTINEGYRCHLSWASLAGATNVSIRIELATTQTYYAQIAFNANGGTGAPATQSVSQQSATPYVEYIIPYTAPTRPGYIFGGWTLNGTTGTVYPMGAKITVYGYNYPPGPTHTLYAYWMQDTSGSMWLYASNRWARGIPWVCTGNRWVKGIPWLCVNGIWKRGG